MPSPRLSTQIPRTVAQAPRRPSGAGEQQGFVRGVVTHLRGEQSRTVEVSVAGSTADARLTMDYPLSVGDAVWCVRDASGLWLVTGLA